MFINVSPIEYGHVLLVRLLQTASLVRGRLVTLMQAIALRRKLQCQAAVTQRAVHDAQHCVQVPRALDMLPQLADPSSMQLALRFCAAVDNPFFRLAFNSLGAYATINHLHFQVGHRYAPIAVVCVHC